MIETKSCLAVFFFPNLKIHANLNQKMVHYHEKNNHNFSNFLGLTTARNILFNLVWRKKNSFTLEWFARPTKCLNWCGKAFKQQYWYSPSLDPNIIGRIRLKNHGTFQRKSQKKEGFLRPRDHARYGELLHSSHFHPSLAQIWWLSRWEKKEATESINFDRNHWLTRS